MKVKNIYNKLDLMGDNFGEMVSYLLKRKDLSIDSYGTNEHFEEWCFKGEDGYVRLSRKLKDDTITYGFEYEKSKVW